MSCERARWMQLMYFFAQFTISVSYVFVVRKGELMYEKRREKEDPEGHNAPLRSKIAAKFVLRYAQIHLQNKEKL